MLAFDWLLRQGLTRPDLLIAAGFSYQVVTAHNGCLQLEVTVHGKAAHAAMPETGHDALGGAVKYSVGVQPTGPALGVDGNGVLTASFPAGADANSPYTVVVAASPQAAPGQVATAPRRTCPILHSRRTPISSE